MSNESGGIVLQGDDGATYFIRDEVLAACKLEGEDLDKANEVIGDEAEVEGFAALTPSSLRVRNLSVRLPDAAQGTRPANIDSRAINSSSTLMCPW